MVKSIKTLSLDAMKYCSKPVTRGKKNYFVSNLTKNVYYFDLEIFDLVMVDIFRFS